MSVYGYIRCATDNATSIIAQREAIERLCKDRSMPLTEVFCDTRCSGLEPFAERAGGDALLRALKTADIIVVRDFARPSRNAPDFAQLIDSLRQRGVTIQLVDDRND